jgi:NAD-dependent deacetylase
MNSLESLAHALATTNGLCVFVTGAGMGLASGIPTFRGTDAGAVWKRDVTELGTVRYFNEEPEGSWRWYLSRFEKVIGAQPNPGHTALVEIEKYRGSIQKPFLLVTQNIDGLHLAAGSQECIEVHGSAHRIRCSKVGCELGAPKGSVERSAVDMTAFHAHSTRDTVPRCKKCGAFLRQHVLWFDEMYTSHAHYQWSRVLEASEKSMLVVFVGTSFSVGVTDLFLSAARERNVTMFNIDPVGSQMRGVSLIPLASEIALPKLAKMLC